MTRRRPQPHAPLAAIICLAKAIGSGPTVWMAKPRAKSRLRVGLVELLGQRVGRRRLVHAHQVGEAAEHDVAGLRHQVLARRVPLELASPFSKPGQAELSSRRGVSMA